jgi:peptide deformylase
MIKSIIKDENFLSQKSEIASKEDAEVIQDLLDTLKANKEVCVGLAANMIGVKKRIIVIESGYFNIAMVNPVIINKSGKYETEEGCLSLIGLRKTTRYNEIEVQYLDNQFQKQNGKFAGWTSQIIQHEIDHCNGIII